MRCEDFFDWLQESLDERNGLELPADVNQHVRECDCCRGQLDAWNQIATVLPVTSGAGNQTEIRRDPNRQRATFVAGIVAVAAAVILVVSFVASDETEKSEKLARVEKTETKASVDRPIEKQAVIASVDPANWWRQLQNRDWIGQTMPTVQSVRDGVAPFGKPFMQAVSILTMGGRNQTS